MNHEIHFAALLPSEMAERAEGLGAKKAELPFLKMFTLAVLAGAFISLGSIFATIIYSSATELPYGLLRLVMGLVFCLGLILVVVGGAELFTGNNLIIMAWASRKVSTKALLRNWVIVYFGNFVGSVGTALLTIVAKQYTFGGNAVGEAAIKIAVSKLSYGFWQALALGILCNGLVCLAIWLTYSGRSTTDKILAVIFPISAFVAAGFEHSVANMYFIPYALLIKATNPSFVDGMSGIINPVELTWGAFIIKNLVPVTLGNIIGGSLFVAIVYWFIYLRNK